MKKGGAICIPFFYFYTYMNPFLHSGVNFEENKGVKLDYLVHLHSIYLYH